MDICTICGKEIRKEELDMYKEKKVHKNCKEIRMFQLSWCFGE